MLIEYNVKVIFYPKIFRFKCNYKHMASNHTLKLASNFCFSHNSTFIAFKFEFHIFHIFNKSDEDLQYIGRKFVDKTICSEEFQNQ